MQQSITWTNVYQVLWGHMAPISHYELKYTHSGLKVVNYH